MLRAGLHVSSIAAAGAAPYKNCMTPRPHRIKTGEPPILFADNAALDRAAELLAAGQLVAFPTETVYGLGADATRDAAVARIFAAKDRPSFNPLIIHVPDAAEAGKFVRLDGDARKLAAAFWPGALTLVLPRVPSCPVSLLASAGLDTLAIRAPAHPVARALLERVPHPIAAPSANPSGQLSPTRAEHVAAGLDGRVSLILDGGPSEIGLESTVLDLSGDRPVLLRPGAITREALEAVLKIPVALPEPGGPDASNPRRSPGLLARHYAPRTPLRLEATEAGPDEALLAFGPLDPATPGGKAQRNLSPSGDVEEAASNLFAMLRELDAAGASRIAVMPVPRRGLGLAINDRLARGAMPDPARG